MIGKMRLNFETLLIWWCFVSCWGLFDCSQEEEEAIETDTSIENYHYTPFRLNLKLLDVFEAEPHYMKFKVLSDKRDKILGKFPNGYLDLACGYRIFLTDETIFTDKTNCILIMKHSCRSVSRTCSNVQTFETIG